MGFFPTIQRRRPTGQIPPCSYGEYGALHVWNSILNRAFVDQPNPVSPFHAVLCPQVTDALHPGGEWAYFQPCRDGENNRYTPQQTDAKGCAGHVRGYV